MSGHSHWATIKHKKGAVDAKRGVHWSKLSRAIIIAARHGGGDPNMNLKLRYAIGKAREVSMPKDNLVHVSIRQGRPRARAWPILLQQRLPVVAIPLRPEDKDAPLDMQQVLSAVYDRAGYEMSGPPSRRCWHRQQDSRDRSQERRSRQGARK